MSGSSSLARAALASDGAMDLERKSSCLRRATLRKAHKGKAADSWWCGAANWDALFRGAGASGKIAEAALGSGCLGGAM